MDRDLFARVDGYINERVAREDPALAGVARSLDEAGMPHVGVAPNQGKLLHVLALLCGARKILEIGTLGGYSTIWLARALPSNGRLISLDVSRKHAEVARKNIDRAAISAQVMIRVGRALDLLPALVDEGEGPFDVVFIDADKEPYPQYFEWALKLSHPGTLIVADNVIRGGRILDSVNGAGRADGVSRFNDMLASNNAVAATIIQTVGIKGHDGLAIAVVTGK